MTASERLRSLDSDRRYWPRNSGQRELYEHTIADALPLIAELAAAAESVTDANPFAWHGSRLLLSLTALKEHLEGGDVT